MESLVLLVIIIVIWMVLFSLTKKLTKKRRNYHSSVNDYGEEFNCNNCLFLVKKIRNSEKSPVISLDPTERQKVLMDDYSFLGETIPWELSCYADEWKADIFKTEEELKKIILEKKRKDKCFFTKYETGKNLNNCLNEVKPDEK